MKIISLSLSAYPFFPPSFSSTPSPFSILDYVQREVVQKMMKKVNPLFLALEMLIFVFKTYTKATRLPPLILSYFTFPQKNL